MPNYGLMNEMVNGIREGMLAFQTARQIKRQNKMENLMKGVQENPETGELEYTPEMKEQKRVEGLLKKQQLAEYEPGSASKALTGLLGEGAVPETMSLREAKELAPFYTTKMKQRDESDLDKAYKQAKITSLLTPKPIEAPGQKFSNVTEIRKEFNNRPEVKTFRDVSTQYEKIKKAAEVPSAAGDLSLIFGYMKMLDPGSTVREGEFANAQNAGGVDDQLRNMYNKARSGERLNDKQRADFINQANNLFLSHQTAFEKAKGEYSDIADIYKIDKNLIFGKQPTASGLLKTKSPIKPSQLTGPKIGEIVDGFKFKGGDPSLKENWEKQ